LFFSLKIKEEQMAHSTNINQIEMIIWQRGIREEILKSLMIHGKAWTGLVGNRKISIFRQGEKPTNKDNRTRRFTVYADESTIITDCFGVITGFGKKNS
jgi:hypothetical protein